MSTTPPGPPPSKDASGLDLEHFLTGYLAEVEDHLASAGKNLLAIEERLARGEPNARAVRELYRSLHTVKGLSAMVGVEPIVELAHAMEAAVRGADRAGARLAAGAIDRLARGLSAIELRVRAVRDRKEVPPAPPELCEALSSEVPPAQTPAAPPRASLDLPAELAAKLDASEMEQLQAATGRGLRAVRLDFAPSRERAAAGLTITSVRERLGAIAEIVKVLPIGVPRTEETPSGIAFALLAVTEADDARVAEAAGLSAAAIAPLLPVAIGATATPGPSEATPTDASAALPDDDDEPGDGSDVRGETVRVEVVRLDDALEKLSALLVTRSRLARAVAALTASGVDARALDEILAEQSRRLRDLRGAIMRARMVSVRDLLERVPLLVRGIARTTGKAVRLEIDAGRAELDKAVGERLFPAIVHLVRNAVDHAIEEGPARARAGKPREGMLRVACYERGGGSLILSIEDDGRGIDGERLAARAGRPAPRTDDELLELLAQPGLSTRDAATTTSGRGLGMDIVRRVVVSELGGDLAVRTVAGRGTTFTLRVPLSITIVDAFSFETGGQPFVVPVAVVEEIVEIDPARVMRPPSGTATRGSARLLDRRGEAVPLVELDAWFELPRATRAATSGLPRKAIVVRRAGAPFAFGVDRMLGQTEVVVRPIDPLVKVPGVSGSTDLGDGKLRLVVDLIAISQRLAHDAEVAA